MEPIIVQTLDCETSRKRFEKHHINEPLKIVTVGSRVRDIESVYGYNKHLWHFFLFIWGE